MIDSVKDSYIRAAYAVLKTHTGPLGARQLVELAIRDNLLPDSINAKTPWKSMHARLSVDIRMRGDSSLFLRAGPGIYGLRNGLNLYGYEAPPRRPPATKEQVLVFPTSLLDMLGRFQGILRAWEPYFCQIVQPSVCKYIDRLAAEQDDTYKQLVAYVMVTSGPKILAFKRGSYNRVADFLRGCHCVGFGGHVSQKDLSAFDVERMGIVSCAARELNEEIKLSNMDANTVINLDSIRIVGLLNDDSSENGRRHLGVVMRYEVSNDIVQRRELSINQLRWLDLTSPSFSLWDFEYWSQLCLREFFPYSLEIQPFYKLIRKSPLRSPHVLCIVGQLGSGKSKATEILTRDFGYSEINSGKVLARLLGVEPVSEATRVEFHSMAWDFIRSPTGPARLAEAIWEEARKIGSDRVLVDGLRQQATYDELKIRTGNRGVGMLFVHTPPDVAYEFYRQRVDSVNSIHDFLSLREAHVESEVADMIAVADGVLYNWQGRDVYHDAICNLMERVQR